MPEYFKFCLCFYMYLQAYTCISAYSVILYPKDLLVFPCKSNLPTGLNSSDNEPGSKIHFFLKEPTGEANLKILVTRLSGFVTKCFFFPFGSENTKFDLPCLSYNKVLSLNRVYSHATFKYL